MSFQFWSRSRFLQSHSKPWYDGNYSAGLRQHLCLQYRPSQLMLFGGPGEGALGHDCQLPCGCSDPLEDCCQHGGCNHALLCRHLCHLGTVHLLPTQLWKQFCLIILICKKCLPVSCQDFGSSRDALSGVSLHTLRHPLEAIFYLCVWHSEQNCCIGP